MSLILDALEQAEQAHQAPAASARLGPAPSATPPAPPHRPSGLWWLLGGAALAVSAGLAWQTWGGLNRPVAAPPAPATDTARWPAQPTLAGGPAQPASAPASPDPSPPAPPRAAPSVSAAASSDPATRTALFAPPVEATPVPDVSVSSAPALTAAPSDQVLAAAPAGARAPVSAQPPPAQPPASPPVAAAPAAPQPATPLPTASELPAESRARLPNLSITGHTYSDNPTLRTLMIDGRMWVEGQTLSPGLRLERIERHQAVFNQSGTRFSVGY